MTDDMHGWLRSGLAHVAAKATVPKLALAARRRSRRTTIRRITVGAVAALVLVVSVVSATWKLFPVRNGLPPADPTFATGAPTIRPTPTVHITPSPSRTHRWARRS
jgi:hypothetical protein